MAIGYKIKNPKTIEEAHQNVQDLAGSAMNKNVMTDLVKIGTTAAATYDPVQIQALINKVDELIDKILKS